MAKYNYNRLSQNLPPKRKSLVLVSDLIENSIYLIYESLSYFNTAKSLIKGSSYPA